jgi:ABC-2 type transport system ATP-binding protein
MTPALAFHDVHRHFDREPVLSGLSFSVQPGEVFALLGRNGAGKTTALRILLGFLAPHAGEARALDMPSHELSGEQRARIGYVSEEHRLYPGDEACATPSASTPRRATRFDEAARATDGGSNAAACR